MSYFIAESIELRKNEIVLRGGDNNVVPRDTHTLRIERTPENDREFVKEIIGGCIQTRPSADKYFWRWIRKRLTARWSWESTERELDAAFAMLEEEYSIRKQVPQAIVVFTDGNKSYLRKDKYGVRRTSYKEDASVVNLYQADYLADRYAHYHTKVERI